MEKRLKLIILFTTLLFVFYSCGKKGNDGTGPGVNGGSSSYSSELSSLEVVGSNCSSSISSDTYDYTCMVGIGTSSAKIKPVAQSSTASISIDNTSVASGSESSVINLDIGDTEINVEIDDGDENDTYNVTITRGYLDYLKAANSSAESSFGSSVSASGNFVIVGARMEDSIESNSGAAYIFEKANNGTWSQKAYLKAGNPGTDDWFGGSVSISGNLAIVGAYQEDSNSQTINDYGTDDGSANYSGAAYIFKKDSDGTWYQEAYLKSENSETYDYFGVSVAISGDLAIVGASGEDSNSQTIDDYGTDSASGAGAAYIFKRASDGTWSQEAYLKAGNSESADAFGVSVAISGNLVIVGATGEDSNSQTIDDYGTDSANSSGAAYIFKRASDGTWSQEAYLKAENSEAYDYFASSVSISGDLAIVGSYQEDSNSQTINDYGTDDGSATGSGAAYIFKRASDGTWSQEAYLKAENAQMSDNFGVGVNISGDLAIVGANGEDSNSTTINDYGTDDGTASYSGAAYIFKRADDGTWSQEIYLKAGNAGSTDHFGYNVAISGDLAIVGANEKIVIQQQ